MTRPTPLVIEANALKRMPSPALRNCDSFAKGAVSKRLGKSKQGNNVTASSIWASQTSGENTTAGGSATTRIAFCQQIVAGSNTNIAVVFMQAYITAASAGSEQRVCRVVVKANTGGNPGATITNGTSNDVNVFTSLGIYEFIFPIPPAVTSGTTYWFCVEMDVVNSSDDFGTATNGSGGSGRVKVTVNNYSTFTTSARDDLYYKIYDTSAIINGLYDLRTGSGSTQAIIATVAGDIYQHARDATPLTGAWTNITSGIGALGSGQNNIYSFATIQDYLFVCDYGNNVQRVWDGSASYTIAQGFRGTFSIGEAATGGGLSNTTGTGYKVMLVTKLDSGGYRATAESARQTITGGGANNRVALTSIVIDGTSVSNFGFDITTGNTPTTAFMTADGGDTYYKIPTANISTGNPVASNSTSANITSVANLTTSNTLLDEYGLEQGYFTSQITTPTCKYSAAFHSMLAMAGDATYPSRIWFSASADLKASSTTLLGGPNIWSTRGGLEGNFIDLEPQDGEVLIGLKAWNGSLYASKRHSFYIIEFTGNASSPFSVRRLSGTLGALSHWSIKEIPNRGLVFLSERGPAICTGTIVDIIPAASNILNKFEPNDSTRYNLSAMQYTTAGHNSTKMQIFWGVSSTSATVRDLTLVYDYENEAFWENNVSANYYNEITDSNFFPSVWSGDYADQVFQHDSGTNDNGASIDWYVETPWMQFKEPNVWKHFDHFNVCGTVQSSGTLLMDFYFDFSATASFTRSMSMTATRFKSGTVVPIGARAKAMKVRIRNSEIDVPVQIDEIGIGYQSLGFSV